MPSMHSWFFLESHANHWMAGICTTGTHRVIILFDVCMHKCSAAPHKHGGQRHCFIHQNKFLKTSFKTWNKAQYYLINLDFTNQGSLLRVCSNQFFYTVMEMVSKLKTINYIRTIIQNIQLSCGMGFDHVFSFHHGRTLKTFKWRMQFSKVDRLYTRHNLFTFQTSPKFVCPVSLACPRAAACPVSAKPQVIHRNLNLLRFVNWFI